MTTRSQEKLMEKCYRVQFESQTLAENFATLHRMALPECTSISAYRCWRRGASGELLCPPGTWHVGHTIARESEECKAKGLEPRRDERDRGRIGSRPTNGRSHRNSRRRYRPFEGEKRRRRPH